MLKIYIATTTGTTFSNSNNNNNNKSLMLKIYVATTTETMLVSNLPCWKFKKYAGYWCVYTKPKKS